MNEDVKALPVVAWIWRWADGEEEVVFVDATTIKFNPEFEDVPTQIASLVRQSDAESALSELRAEVERLRDDLRFVERWASHHGQKPSITPAEVLSVIQHYPPIMAITLGYTDGKAPNTPDPFARADTAEARLERARGLLDLASQHVKSNARLKNAIDAFLGEGK